MCDERALYQHVELDRAFAASNLPLTTSATRFMKNTAYVLYLYSKIGHLDVVQDIRRGKNSRYRL